jgi:sugar lactone lactonase YvrE
MRFTRRRHAVSAWSLIAALASGCGSGGESAGPSDALVPPESGLDAAADGTLADASDGATDATLADTAADTTLVDTAADSTLADTALVDASDGGASDGAGDSGAADATDAADAADAPTVDAAGDTGSFLGTVDYVPGVTVATLAGSASAGSSDGTGGAASFENPTGLARAATGELYVTEYDGNRVRAVTPAGGVTTIGQATGFVGPFSAAVVPTTGLLVLGTDFDSSGVKGATTGTVWRLPTTAADAGAVAPLVVLAGMGRPRGLAGLTDGRLFVSDRLRSVVGLLDLGTGTLTPLAGQANVTGYVDGVGSGAQFSLPHGCAQLADGSVLVADTGNHRLRRVALDGTVSTWAGSGGAGTHDGPRLAARFQSPRDVAVDAAGNVYVVDIGLTLASGARVDVRVRRIAPSGVVQTLAGDGAAGFVEGAGSTAEFYGLEGIEVTPDGKTVYVTDGNGGDGSAHHRIRKIAIP